MDNQYLYDGNGNRTHKKQLGGETLYHYDPLNQLKKVEYPSYTEELFYDKAGNRTRRISQGSVGAGRFLPGAHTGPLSLSNSAVIRRVLPSLSVYC